jgi:heptosyltransferase-2
VRLAGLRKIYVRAPNWVGDLVMATASLQRIRRGFPGAEILVGLRPYLRPLLEGSDLADRYLPTPRGGLRALLQQVAALRAERCELAIVLPNSWPSGLVPFLARVPLRLGYRQGRPWILNLGLRAPGGRPWYSRHGPRRLPKPMPIYYRELLDVIELPDAGLRPVLHVTDAQRGNIEAWLRARGVPAGARLVLLNAGASYGASKLWDPERFAEVARRFTALGLTPIFLAGPAEVDLVRPIAAKAAALAAVDPVLPLDALKALVQRAALVVTTDTGPRHIAVAFDVPVVCLLGPTDRRYTDYCLEHTELLRKELPCSPCQRKVCPLGHHDCMRLITVDEVVAAAQRLLALAPG